MNNGSSQVTTEKIRIMVVEDEPDIGAILVQILRDKYDVVRAMNGLEALERLSWYQPDLTIMDLMMPVLDGFDTTRAIKKDNDYTDMPVMFLTARKDNNAVREALMAGGDIYLEKPFDPPELLIRLQEMVDKNAIKPKPKLHTLDQIRTHFEPFSDKSAAPLTRESEKPLSLTEQLAEAAAKPKARVLIVQDSDAITKLMRHKLRSNFETLFASDPEAALDKIAAYQPDILLMNVETHTFNGIHFARLLQVNRQFKVPVILLMADPNDKEKHAEIKAAGARYCAVPVSDIDGIELKFREIIERPDFQRQRKRLDYREILRREDSSDAG